MLRITKVAESGVGVTLKVEGQVAADWVAELEAECRRWQAQRRQVRLDFENVTWIDRDGLRRLRVLCREAVDVVNCPALMRELLDGATVD